MRVGALGWEKQREKQKRRGEKRTVILVEIYVSKVGTYVDVSLMASVKGEPEIRAYWKLLNNKNNKNRISF